MNNTKKDKAYKPSSLDDELNKYQNKSPYTNVHVWLFL